MRLKLSLVGDAKRATKKSVAEFRDLLDKPRSSLRSVFGTEAVETRSAVRLPRSMRARVPSARAALTQDLKSFFATLDPSKPFTRNDYKRFLQTVQKSTTGKISDRPAWADRVKEKTAERLGKNRQAAARLATQHIKEQAEAGSKKPVRIKADRVAKKAARAATVREAKAANKFAKDTVRDLKNLFRRGIGKNGEQLVAQLQRMSGRRAPIRSLSSDPAAAAREVSNAFFARAEKAARRLGQTELAHAYNEHARIAGELIAQQSHPGITYYKRWDSRLDMKVCQFCKALHGDTARLGSPFNISKMNEPPAHPFCRCTLTIIAVPIAVLEQ